MTFEEICAQMREKLDALAEGNYQAGLELIDLTDDLLRDPELCEQYFGKKGELPAGDDTASMLAMIVAHACKDYNESKQSDLQQHMKNMFIAIYAEPPIYTNEQLAMLLPNVKHSSEQLNTNVVSLTQAHIGNLTKAFADTARIAGMAKIANIAETTINIAEMARTRELDEVPEIVRIAEMGKAGISEITEIAEIAEIAKTVKKEVITSAAILPNIFSKQVTESFFSGEALLNLFREEDRVEHAKNLHNPYQVRLDDLQANATFADLDLKTREKLSYSALAMPHFCNYFRAQENNPFLQGTPRACNEASECARLLGNSDLDVDDKMRKLEERIKDNPQLYRVILSNDQISEPIATSFVAHTIALQNLRAPLQKLVSYYKAHHNPHKQAIAEFQLNLLDNQKYTAKDRLEYIRDQGLPQLENASSWAEKKIIDRIKDIITNTVQRLFNSTEFKAEQGNKQGAIKTALDTIQKAMPTPRMTR
jgi:hypothetical protein